CVVLAPPVLGYLPSAHVDTASLACFVLGLVLLHRLATERDPWSAVLGGGMFGLAMAVKLSNLAYALPGLLLLLVLGWRLPAGRVRRWALAGAVAAALLSSPSFVRAWIEHGSPTYPVALEIAGHELF